jgi:hypothetical protein
MASGDVNPSRHCNVLCGRKKLPFAGYSIVKERVVLAGRRSSAGTSYPTRVACAMQARRFGFVNRSTFARGAVACHPKLASLAHRIGRARQSGGGGEYRARTGDLLVANQALSQLS